MRSSILLDVAIEQFARLGFEGASTRDIARASKTAMSSITYHFGGKEGLYLAAAEHIARSIAEKQAPTLAAADAGTLGSREQAEAAILALVESFGRMMLADESEAWAQFIIREQQHPTQAFERLYRGAMEPLLGRFIGLLGQLRPDLAELEVRATAMLMVGQAIVLRAARASVCKVLAIDAVDPATAELLLQRLRANTHAIISQGVA